MLMGSQLLVAVLQLQLLWAISLVLEAAARQATLGKTLSVAERVSLSGLLVQFLRDNGVDGGFTCTAEQQRDAGG